MCVGCVRAVNEDRDRHGDRGDDDDDRDGHGDDDYGSCALYVCNI